MQRVACIVEMEWFPPSRYILVDCCSHWPGLVTCWSLLSRTFAGLPCIVLTRSILEKEHRICPVCSLVIQSNHVHEICSLLCPACMYCTSPSIMQTSLITVFIFMLNPLNLCQQLHVEWKSHSLYMPCFASIKHKEQCQAYITDN